MHVCTVFIQYLVYSTHTYIIQEFVMEAVKGFPVMLIYCNGQNVQC